jgi:hypothetical protein
MNKVRKPGNGNESGKTNAISETFPWCWTRRVKVSVYYSSQFSEQAEAFRLYIPILPLRASFASRLMSCRVASKYHVAIKTNNADSQKIIVQIERRLGMRFVFEVLEIRGHDLEGDHYDPRPVYIVVFARTQESKTWIAAT